MPLLQRFDDAELADIDLFGDADFDALQWDQHETVWGGWDDDDADPLQQGQEKKRRRVSETASATGRKRPYAAVNPPKIENLRPREHEAGTATEVGQIARAQSWPFWL